MSQRLILLCGFLVCLVVSASQAQTNIYTFTANDGKFYRQIKVVRVDDDGILYTFTQSTGGGRLKFSQLPEDIVDEIKALKPREKTFADSLPAVSAKSSVAAAASSNRAGNGEKSDSATLALTNNTARAMFSFSRKVSTNDIQYLIAITYYGTNYLGLGDADSLTFDADGALVTYSPVPGTHRVEASDSQMSESQIYSSSLRDLQKICEARALGVALSGPLGNDNFAVPSATILRNFGHYCITNASAGSVSMHPSASNSPVTAIKYQLPTQSAASQPAEVLDATARTIDDDPFTTQWAWKVTLHAPPTPPKDFLLEFQFLDADGYVLAHEIEYPVKLSAGETNTLTGQTAIKTALSGRIKTCKVVMK
jgi:hypothetical protein